LISQRKSIDAIAVLMLSYFSSAVRAQPSTDPMETCFQMTDSGARVACYDQEMQRRHAAARAASAAPSAPAKTPASNPTVGAASSATAAQQSPDDTIGLDGKQLSIRRKEEGIQTPAMKPIVTALAHLTLRPGHQYLFELDNGQVWESTDSEPDLFVSPHETVMIRPGVLGAFFLKTNGGLSIRVHRVR
jgi:hypothetical protein